MTPTQACFLDRDGVVVEEVNYLGHPDDVRIIPQTANALKRLKAAGYLCVIITNQAGVARGYFDENAIHDVHCRIDELLNQHGATIDRYYHCPHHPQGSVPEYAIKCNCRKPNSALLEKAAEECGISLATSFLIGDKMSDIDAAANVGCQGILVRTGHGKSHEQRAKRDGILVCDHIGDAVTHILNSL